MITPEPAVIGLALLLDLALGDPPWLPHPVVLIGRLISTLETVLRRMVPFERAAGVLLLLATLAATVAATW
ncbi:MAG TPA: cobalamin biosynthesis protein, partial [Desulfuromonadaceae bacterium]